MTNEARDIIDLQLAAMKTHLRELLGKVARRCTPVWENQHALDTVLHLWIQRMSYCRLLYAVDAKGVQISANVHANHIDHKTIGQDLSQRPYFNNKSKGLFSLSDVYISHISKRSCVTAIHAVTHDTSIAGYIAADFDLLYLPLLQTTSRQENNGRRIAGDPAIRVNQTIRITWSLVDKHIDDVNIILNELICEHGIFHAKLHYSSSRMTLWLMDDPYHYRIHVQEELTDPALCMVYRKRTYPTSATVPVHDVLPVLKRCAELRLRRDHQYLRSSSLNIMNGLVGLNFSSDDTLYLSSSEFLNVPLKLL